MPALSRWHRIWASDQAVRMEVSPLTTLYWLLLWVKHGGRVGMPAGREKEGGGGAVRVEVWGVQQVGNREGWGSGGQWWLG